MSNDQSVKCKVVRKIGSLSGSEKKSNWNKELNLVSWSDNPAKFDIRPWGPNNQPGRGITLTFDEFKKLVIHGVKFLKETSEVVLETDVSNIDDEFWNNLLEHS